MEICQSHQTFAAIMGWNVTKDHEIKSTLQVESNVTASMIMGNHTTKPFLRSAECFVMKTFRTATSLTFNRDTPETVITIPGGLITNNKIK